MKIRSPFLAIAAGTFSALTGCTVWAQSIGPSPASPARWAAVPALEQIASPPGSARSQLQPQLAPRPDAFVAPAGFLAPLNESDTAVPNILSGAAAGSALPVPQSPSSGQPRADVGQQPVIPGGDQPRDEVPSILSGGLPAPQAAPTLQPQAVAPDPWQPQSMLEPQQAGSANDAEEARLSLEQELASIQVPAVLAGNSLLAPQPPESHLLSPQADLSLGASGMAGGFGAGRTAVPAELVSGPGGFTLEAILPATSAGPGLSRTELPVNAPAGETAGMLLGEIVPLGQPAGRSSPLHLLELDPAQAPRPTTIRRDLSVAAMTGPMASPESMFGALKLEDGFRRQPAEALAATRNQTSPAGYSMSWSQYDYTWISPVFSHNRLFFEQANYERYGMTHGDYLAPVMSSAHFFGTAALMPLRLVHQSPCDRVYTLGHQRPGDCARFQLQADNRLGLSN